MCPQKSVVAKPSSPFLASVGLLVIFEGTDFKLIFLAYETIGFIHIYYILLILARHWPPLLRPLPRLLSPSWFPFCFDAAHNWDYAWERISNTGLAHRMLFLSTMVPSSFPFLANGTISWLFKLSVWIPSLPYPQISWSDFGMLPCLWPAQQQTDVRLCLWFTGLDSFGCSLGVEWLSLFFVSWGASILVSVVDGVVCNPTQ